MSDLHLVLSDPPPRRESALSFLFNAGEAGLYFQREIFQYLSIGDVRNLRMANHRHDQVVRGAPMWITQGNHGNPTFSLTPPSNPAPAPLYNSTLNWIGTRCNGVRFQIGSPHRSPCQTGPLTVRQIKRCRGVPAPLNPNHNGLQCSGDVCIHCVNNVANFWNADETQAIRRGYRTRLCRQCQLHEARRHPYGYSSCICPSLLGNRWLCFPCRHETKMQMIVKRVNHEDMISSLHRDRQGRKVHDTIRLRRPNPPCPGCARTFVDRNGDHQLNHVTYCTSCRGVIVKPMLGPTFRPTNLMSTPPTRWSERLAAKYAAMPPLDFTPDIVIAH